MIDYRIVEPWPDVFLVLVPDDYDRAMLFLRAQTCYESPSARFRGRPFDLWDYVKYYTQEHGSFSYARDWRGFNLPYTAARDCYAALPQRYVTKYDRAFQRLLGDLGARVERPRRAYIVGADREGSRTAQHELYHARYFTDRAYRARANALLDALPAPLVAQLRRNLLALGYVDDDRILRDELQAFLQALNSRRFARGLDWRRVRTVGRQFREAMQAD